MPEILPVDSPKLQLAVQRMKRTMWLWALLMAGMGVLTLGSTGGAYPLIAFSWFVIAVLLIVGDQPVILALAAVQWGLSLAAFAPGFQELLGPDPLVTLFEPSTLEIIVLVIVRVIFMASTWNQFLLYRLLYGTKEGYGLEEGKANIPEILPNRTNRLAWSARLIGFAALAANLIAIPLRTSMIARHLLSGRVQYLAINQSTLLFAKLPLFDGLLAGMLLAQLRQMGLFTQAGEFQDSEVLRRQAGRRRDLRGPAREGARRGGHRGGQHPQPRARALDRRAPRPRRGGGW